MIQKAAVIHPCLSAYGGAELVAFHVLKVLLERNWDVSLLSDVWDPGEGYRRFGLLLKDKILWHHYYRLKANRLGFLSVYQTLMKDVFRALRAPRLKSIDLVFDTYNGEGYHIKTREKNRIIYFHEVPRYEFKGGKIKGLYYIIPKAWWRRFTQTLEKSTIVCNSGYTSKLLEEFYGLEGTVIYPPAQMEDFTPLAGLEPRDDLIVTLGRFAPDKNLDIVVEAFSSVVKERPNVKLLMIGSTGEASSREVIRNLITLASSLKVKENMQLIGDASLNQVREALGKAKIMVSTKPKEPFGTALVQGMASGCVPIAHRSGGQFTDVINYDRAGLSYETPEELAEQVIRILESESFRKNLKMKAIRRTEQFNTQRFENGICKLMAL